VTHLNPEELLDVADGTRASRDFPHLQSCAFCTREVAGLRAAMGAAAEVSVPDPSPLFWDHLSARVRDAIAGEERPAGRHVWSWRLAAAAAAAVILLTVVVGPALRAPMQPGTDALPAGSADPWRSGDVSAFDDDRALALLVDLTAEMDWDTAAEAGLVPAEGAVDRVVFALSAEERVELHRLLQEALAGSGA
jgi:hypothetical protein